MTEPPSGFDAVANPTAYDRWRAAYAAQLPIRPNPTATTG